MQVFTGFNRRGAPLQLELLAGAVASTVARIQTVFAGVMMDAVKHVPLARQYFLFFFCSKGC